MWFFGLIVVLLIGAVAVVASGRWGAMSTAYDDRPDMTVPARQALTSTDIESARFAVGLRGYRMDEVDTLLERVAKEVAERDRRIADLERAVAPIVEAPDGRGFTSTSYDPADFDDTGTQPPILVGGDFPEPTAPEPTAPEPSAAEPPATVSSATVSSAAEPSAAEPSAAEPAAGQPGGAASEAPMDSTPAAGAPDDAGTPSSAPGAAPTAADAVGASVPAAATPPRGGADDRGEQTGERSGPQVSGGASAEQLIGEPDDEPETSELPRTSQAAADEYARLQAEARAVLEAQSQPGPPRRTPPPPRQSPTQPAPSQPAPTQPAPVQPAPVQPAPVQPAPVQQAPAQPAAAESDQASGQQTAEGRGVQPGETQAQVQSVPLTPAQRYEQHMNSQHQPTPTPPQHPTGTSSATAQPPASEQPAAQPSATPPPAPEQTHWTAQPTPHQSADARYDAPHQSADAQYDAPRRSPDTQYDGPGQVEGAPQYDASQAEGLQQGEQVPGAEANGSGERSARDGEGWQFWPPADQAGEGAYQRPS